MEGKRNFQPSHARPDDRLGTLRNAGRVADSAGVESPSGGWCDGAAYFFLGRGLAPGSFSTPFGLIRFSAQLLPRRKPGPRNCRPTQGTRSIDKTRRLRAA